MSGLKSDRMEAEDETAIRPLGKRELGPHAFEKQMPRRIARLVEAESGAAEGRPPESSSSNRISDVIPTLALVLECSRDTALAYLCRPSTVQIHKLSGEGDHFCTYRNIQMLLLPSLPTFTITELQGMIETAWARGFNAHGHVETQGIVGTRKHIGTSEVEALCGSLGITCRCTAYGGADAWRQLLDAVEDYFSTPESEQIATTAVASMSVEPPETSNASPGESRLARVLVTSKSPVFLMRPSHSITIVGIERDKRGRRQLLVFDPAYQPRLIKSALKNTSTSTTTTASRDERGNSNALVNRLLLFQYRRNERHLKQFRKFETLMLT